MFINSVRLGSDLINMKIMDSRFSVSSRLGNLKIVRAIMSAGHHLREFSIIYVVLLRGSVNRVFLRVVAEDSWLLMYSE